MEMIEDKVFGYLKYDYDWERVYSITMFNRETDIYLSITGDEDEEIQDTQRNAFLQFQANKDKILNDSEEKLLEYYIQNYDQLAYRLNDDRIEEVLPRVSTIEELGKIMEPTMLVFQRNFDTNINKFGIALGCKWDDEAGIGIRFKNGEIVEIGSDDIILGL